MPDIKNVEIFATGTWNGRKYTDKDLDDIVNSFGHVGFEPPLKLGHNDGQKMLQKDGLPAAGWVENIKKVGSKLVADFKDVPKKIFELLEKKAYKTKSVEIYHNLTVQGGKTFSHVLKAVALLGADIPEVEDLKDVLALYDGEGREYFSVNYAEEDISQEGIKGKTSTTVPSLIFPKGEFTRATAISWAKEHDFKSDKVDETEDSFRLRQRNPGDFTPGSFRTITPGENQSREEERNMAKDKELEEKEKEKGGEMAKLQAKIKELEKALATATAKNEKKMSSEKEVEFSNKLDVLSTELEQTKTELADEKHKGKVEAVNKIASNYVRDRKITPAQSKIITGMLMASNGNTEVKLFSKDGKEDLCSIAAAIEKFISIQPEIFDLNTHSQEGADKNDVENRISAYCKEHDLDKDNIEHYKQAYAVVGSDA